MFDKYRFWFLRLVYEPVFNQLLSFNFLLCINLKFDQEGDSNQKKQPCIYLKWETQKLFHSLS